jgi:hypothetical protein
VTLCEQCGAGYESVRSESRFCSTRCRVRAYRDRQAERGEAAAGLASPEPGREPLLRPDQAAAAVTLARAGADAAGIAAALAVPVEVVDRSVRLAPAAVLEAVLPMPVRSEVQSAVDVLWPEPAGPDEGPAPLPPSERRELGRVLVVGERLAVRKLPRPAAWRAPNYVEDDPAWPASASSEDRWQVVSVHEGRTVERVALRELVLWGERVLVDEDRRVFCPDCRKLLDVVELGRNLFQGQDDLMGGGIPSHRLGLPPVRAVSR